MACTMYHIPTGINRMHSQNTNMRTLHTHHHHTTHQPGRPASSLAATPAAQQRAGTSSPIHSRPNTFTHVDNNINSPPNTYIHPNTPKHSKTPQNTTRMWSPSSQQPTPKLPHCARHVSTRSSPLWTQSWPILLQQASPFKQIPGYPLSSTFPLVCTCLTMSL